MAEKARFMLDTNICIYIHREKPDGVLRRFRSLCRGEAVISVVTWGELLFGAAKSQKSKQVHTLLEEFSYLVPIVPMSRECGRIYGEIRAALEKQGQGVGNNDLWIAAHAMAEELTLVTNNTREFERIPKLALANWA